MNNKTNKQSKKLDLVRGFRAGDRIGRNYRACVRLVSEGVRIMTFGGGGFVMLFMGIIYRHTWACYHDMVLLYIHICTVYTAC